MAPLIRTAIVIASLAFVVWPARAQDAKKKATRSEPDYALETTAAKHVRDELTFVYVAPKVGADEWIFYVPRLPELVWQTEVRSALLPAGRPVRESSDLGRTVLFARIPVKGAEGRDQVTIRVEYEANLRARRLVRRQPGEKAASPVRPLSPIERRLALAAGHQFDLQSESFQSWLDAREMRCGPNEGDIDFARRAFLYIKREFQYLTGADLDRLASHILTQRRSDSGGLSIVFTSILRANGIPALVASGRWARPSQPGRNAADEPHVAVTFFASGVGWVPVDVGSAVTRDESPDGLAYFGTDNADFLTLHFDTDLEFDSIYFGHKTVEFVHAPVFWVAGSGSLDDFKLLVTSIIQADPLDLSRPFPKPATSRSTRTKK
jgi:transglutaminase-like putative cysteine protease